tara:strand:- start:273 stop:413 length:141 start_codon:yes stop_codon:yes gene_type:complete
MKDRAKTALRDRGSILRKLLRLVARRIAEEIAAKSDAIKTKSEITR